MSSFKVNINGLDIIKQNFEKVQTQAREGVDDILNTFGLNTVNEAQTRCPVDEGHLRSSITYEKTENAGKIEVKIIVAATYAAYLEFGTRRFAESYVSSLPSDWQSFAGQFRGGGGGDYFDFLNAILDWVMRKGIANRYSVKTHEAIKIKLGSKGKVGMADEKRLEETAYAIALSILRNGIKPQPYLYPAIEVTSPQMIDDFKNLFQ